MAPVALIAVYMGGFWYQLMVSAVMFVGVIELFRMCVRAPTVTKVVTWFVPGFLYLASAWLCILWLRQPDDTGMTVVIWLFALVWGADSGAYLAGSLIGGPKLAPGISPNKTWAGLIGGVTTAAAIGYLAHVYFDVSESAVRIVMFSAVLAVISQGGDLLESVAKRCLDVKDSGNIIPGHGGVLDRIDGLVAAAIGAGVARWNYQEHTGLWL